MAKTYELMEKLASNHHQMVYVKTLRKSTPDVLQMEALSTLSTHISALTKKMQMLEVQCQANVQMTQTMYFDYCEHDRPWDQCPLHVESVNYVHNFNRNQNNPYSNTYK